MPTGSRSTYFSDITVYFVCRCAAQVKTGEDFQALMEFCGGNLRRHAFLEGIVAGHDKARVGLVSSKDPEFQEKVNKSGQGVVVRHYSLCVPRVAPRKVYEGNGRGK